MRLAQSFLLLVCLVLTSCDTPAQLEFYAIRLATPSLLRFSADLVPLEEIALNLPPRCSIWSSTASPQSAWLALQLVCDGSEIAWVQNINTRQSHILLPNDAADSHILAWADANTLYLRVDSLGNPRIILADIRSADFFSTRLPFTVYHMDSAPENLLYVLTQGIGLGSELWRADSPQPVYRSADSILAFARYSPDGKKITFIKMPDTSAAFPPGELWLMESGGKNPRLIASADAGHGFSPVWSPDGQKIAFITPEQTLSIFSLPEARTRDTGLLVLDTPAWSLDSQQVYATVASGDTMEIWFYETNTNTHQLIPGTEQSAFPGWIGSGRP